jgi:uncharacterized cupin superfamily protein
VIVHWDEVERERVERGYLCGTWSDLGRAAGSDRIGAKRIELGPDEVSTPVHVHAQEEEIFFVLSGSGLSWQDGETYEVAAGDCIVHLVLREEHTLRGGPDGLVVLAFGEREQGWAAHLPRSGISWLFPTWVETGVGKAPWEREVAAGPPDFPEPSPRPEIQGGEYHFAQRFDSRPIGPLIVNLADCAAEERGQGDSQFVVRNLGVTAGTRRTGLRHHVVAPGKMAWPPHCHSAEEELLVVLEGEGTLLLGDERHPVHAGHVVSRPPGTRVAHAIVAGDSGLTYLAYGNRDPNDIAYFPRSDKVFLRGVGVIGRIQRLDYWDGEA